MAARVTRAKKKIAAARIPYAVRPPTSCAARARTPCSPSSTCSTRPATRRASGDDLVRDELTARALDLARMLRLLLPADREVAGLLALLLVHQARRATRTDADGRLLRLEEQDRVARGTAR